MGQLLIPVGGGSHWDVIGVDIPGKTLFHLCSLAWRPEDKIRVIRRYLVDEWRERESNPGKEMPDFANWKVLWTDDIARVTGSMVPQQSNGYDCGVFACLFCVTLARCEEARDAAMKED